MIYDGKQQLFTHAEQNSIIRLVNTEDETQAKNHEEGKTSFSLRMAKYLTTTGIGDMIDVVNVILSVGLTVLHAIDTYFWDPKHREQAQSNGLILILELAFDLYFILAFVINFYISENKLFFAFSSQSIIEYVSVIPSLLARLGTYNGDQIVYLTRVFRFLYAYKLDKVLQRHSMEVARLAYQPLCTVLAVIIINASILIVVEQDSQFHEYVYFMVVTMATVGFGDVVPQTTLGRFSIIFTLLVMFLVLPTQLQDLTRVLALRSEYARIDYQTTKDSDHVLLLGSSQVEGFKTFLTELYHSDHGLNDTTSLILQPIPPPEEMTLLLRHPQLQSKVIYLEGHPLSNRDLERTKAQECKCVIVLANKTSYNPRGDDYRNIIHAFAVKKYVKRYRQRGIRVCLQVLQPSSKGLFFNSLGGDDVDQVICVDELKLYLLAKTCLCPGINTLISFLIQSTKPSYDTSKYSKDSPHWIDDYLNGMQNEIYRVPLEPENFVGLPFGQISQHIYRQFGLILFALEVTLQGETTVFVNPAEYLFEDSLHFGYVIAANMPDVGELQRIKFPDYVTRNYCFPNVIPKGALKRNSLQVETEQIREVLSQGIQEGDKVRHQAFYQVKPNTLQLGLSKVGDEKYENHFIVCGVVPDMKYLMMPLRARSLKTIQPIIILHPDPIPTEIQVQINKFPKVFYLQGSPLKLQDLDKACITKAAALVILQKNQEEENISSMVDADTIFIYKTVKLLNPSINIITELASISTISFLQLSRNNYVQKYGWSVSEPFASGEIYVSTMLDTLICQAYYNPFITSIFDQMILGNANMKRKTKQTYHAMKLQQSNLFLIAVPPKYQEKTFGELYDALVLDQKMMPIGLYRGEKVKDNNKPYVFLKPPGDVKLSIRDKVFVLSAKQPKEAEQNLAAELGQNLLGMQAQQPNIFNFKSKLQGEEGRVDLEYAKELWKFKNQMNEYREDLIGVNQRVFNQGLVSQDFVPRIRQSIRTELANVSLNL